MYQYGLVSVSFREKSVEEIISAAKEAKLSCIEWGSDVHAPYNDEQKLRLIAQRCLEEKISICSYGTYFRLGATDINELYSYIDAARILGTDILRLWCGTKSYSLYTKEEFSQLTDICKGAAFIAEENKVTLCMECHNNTVTDCAEGALRLMRSVDSENFKMYWQPNQYKTVDENIDYAVRLAPYTKHIHVFNWEKENKYPLQEAESVWKRYLSCFTGDRCLLLEFMPDANEGRLEIEAGSLKLIADKSEIM